MLSRSEWKTALLCNVSSQNSIVLFASASQDTKQWNLALEREGLVAVVLFLLFLRYFYPLSFLLARFLCLVSFPLHVFFSLRISIDTTVALMLITFQHGYCSHPVLVFLISPSPVSPPTAAILIHLLTLFQFLTKECMVATYCKV